MRTLTINDEAREKCNRVIEYAKAHPFHLPNDGTVPGDNPDHVAQLDTFRCVFTFTHDKGQVFRHLSISVPGGKFPHQFAAWTIATMFGFTGWDGKSSNVPSGWLCGLNEHDRCIVVAQEIE